MQLFETGLLMSYVNAYDDDDDVKAVDSNPGNMAQFQL